jgi:hypothetical protein
MWPGDNHVEPQLARAPTATLCRVKQGADETALLLQSKKGTTCTLIRKLQAELKTYERKGSKIVRKKRNWAPWKRCSENVSEIIKDNLQFPRRHWPFGKVSETCRKSTPQLTVSSPLLSARTTGWPVQGKANLANLRRFSTSQVSPVFFFTVLPLFVACLVSIQCLLKKTSQNCTNLGEHSTSE